MKRTEWQKQMKEKTEKLYDHFAPLYWVNFGLQPNETHRAYLQKFLDLLNQQSLLLSAGCGAGRYDGILTEAGHNVVGIDLSAGMLERAKEKFPEIHYEKKGLLEIDYQNEFDGVVCIDVLEHIFPEDWPKIIHKFREALKPGGILYFTLDVSGTDTLEESFELAKAKGLPVVFGEVAADVDKTFEKLMALKKGEVPPGDLADQAVYHYYPAVEQVKKWIILEKFIIEAEGKGKWYKHFLVRKT